MDSCKSKGVGCEGTQEIRKNQEKANSMSTKKRGKSRLFSKKQKRRGRK